uniref:Calcium-dependent protein kinase n=1 Tax=Rhizophora mucronata TaxID=61149 RepID=A0A2P2N0S8_RHIMU
MHDGIDNIITTGIHFIIQGFSQLLNLYVTTLVLIKKCKSFM